MGRMTMTIGSIDLEVRQGGEVVHRSVRGFSIDTDDAALSIRCDSCGAQPWAKCTTRSGSKKGQPRSVHEARRRAAARQGIAAPLRPLEGVDLGQETE